MILFRYLARETLYWVSMVQLALLVLFAFFDFVHELGDLGVGKYTLGRIAIVVALGVPGHVYELLPIATLIGTLAALARLVSQSEFTVMRVSGLSPFRMAAQLLGIGALLTVAGFVLGEYVVPYSDRASSQMRLSSTQSVVAREFRSGVWVRDGSSYINIRRLLPDATLMDIRIFEFDDSFRLRSLQLAARGVFEGNGRWRLTDVVETRFAANSTVRVAQPEVKWDSVLNPEILSVVMVIPEQMSLDALRRYVGHLSENHQKTTRYEIALWTKIAYPLAIPVLMVLALPFAFHNTRVSGMGGRVFAGIMLGMGFHLANRMFAHLGLLNDWNPLASAVTPTLVCLGAALVMLWHAERV